MQAAQRKVSEEIWQKARTTGVVDVIVNLNVPWKSLGYLTPAERYALQDAIAAAQDKMLAELAGTKSRLISRFAYIPGLALEVGPDALAVLEKSNLVKTVEQSTGDRPS